MKNLILLLGAVLLSVSAAAQQPANLLKNGSFEGGIRYWYEANQPDHQLVRGDTQHGEYSIAPRQNRSAKRGV